MEEKQEEKKLKRNRIFVFAAIAFIALLLIISVVEIISINSLNNKIKNQQQDIAELNQELNAYKDKATQSGEDFFEGVER